MARITREALERQLAVINSKFKEPVFSLDKYAGGWRLERGHDYVSPRLKTSEMHWWLDGFIEGLAATQREWRILL